MYTVNESPEEGNIDAALETNSSHRLVKIQNDSPVEFNGTMTKFQFTRK